MKYLVLSFLAGVSVLAWLVTHEKEASVFADGRLMCAPLPPPYRPPAHVELQEPPMTLAELAPPPAPIHTVNAKIQLASAEPSTDLASGSRFGDAADWGIPKVDQPEPLVVASTAMPTMIQPAVPAVTPIPTPAPLTPNLYLPEGALNEEGALLTLIKNELRVYEEPDVDAVSAPVAMREGEKVRPLTRLRNEKDFDWIKIERDGRAYWAQAEYFIRVDPRNRTSAKMKNLDFGSEAVDKDSALPPDYAPSDMVELRREFILDNKDVKLRRETATALERMVHAATKQKLRLKVVSGFRDFGHQKKLYLEAIERHGPKQNSVAAPGYSEHQLGTTIDVSNTDRRYMLAGRFGSTAEGRWLHDNAEKFGFRNSYTRENSDEVGYRPEPWHFRYVGVKNTNGGRTQIAAR